MDEAVPRPPGRPSELAEAGDAGMTMVLREIHRYPVKSMLGERLTSVAVDRRGLTGDRLWAVRDEDGRLASGKNTRRFRRMDRVFELRAALAPGARSPRSSGTPVISWPSGVRLAADDPGVDEAVSRQLGRPVRIVREAVASHMDGGCVSLIGTATLAAVADLLGDAEPVDPRRFRVNLVIQTDEPYVEDTWVGRAITVGALGLRVVQPIERCRTVDIRQGEVPEHGRILTTLGARRQLMLAVYADPTGSATIRTGDELTVRSGDELTVRSGDELTVR